MEPLALIEDALAAVERSLKTDEALLADAFKNVKACKQAVYASREHRNRLKRAAYVLKRSGFTHE